MRNHYDTLGVRTGSDASEIRAAYLNLIKRIHPDAGERGGTAVKADLDIYEINLAYTVLRDLRTRAAYDAELHHVASLEAAAADRRLPLVIRPTRTRTAEKLLVCGVVAGAVLLG